MSQELFYGREFLPLPVIQQMSEIAISTEVELPDNIELGEN